MNGQRKIRIHLRMNTCLLNFSKKKNLILRLSLPTRTCKKMGSLYSHVFSCPVFALS